MRVPRIRVDGFNNNFEKKIFGEIVSSISTSLYIKSVVSDLGKYEVIQQGDTPILGYSDDQPFEKYKSVILFGDHTLSLYRPKAPFLLATDGIKILQSTILKRDYLYYLTQNYIPKSQGYKRHFSVLKQVFVNYSRDSSEQSIIGSLFSNLDDLVASYKDNLTNYQSLKETMLSKMFPKVGQTVPEIRLDGFEGEWELYELKSRAETITKGTTPKDKSWQGEVNYIKTESINRDTGSLVRTTSTSLEEHLGYLKRSILKEGDVLFSIVGTLGVVGIVDKKDLPANTNQQIAIIRLKRDDAIFMLNFLKSPRIKSFIKSDSTIGAQPSLSLWQIEKIKVSLPPSLEEQQAIGTYFSNLDNLINSRQEKIFQLETLKKKLLQDMFI